MIKMYYIFSARRITTIIIIVEVCFIMQLTVAMYSNSKKFENFFNSDSRTNWYFLPTKTNLTFDKTFNYHFPITTYLNPINMQTQSFVSITPTRILPIERRRSDEYVSDKDIYNADNQVAKCNHIHSFKNKMNLRRTDLKQGRSASNSIFNTVDNGLKEVFGDSNWLSSGLAKGEQSRKHKKKIKKIKHELVGHGHGHNHNHLFKLKNLKSKHGHKKFKKLKKFIFPLLLAYKLKFFVLVPVLIGGLVLLVGATGTAGFFFALFAAVMSLRQDTLYIKQEH